MTRTVLVVDDEPDIRELVRLSLEQISGWRVLLAASGTEALGVAAEEQPDAILLDVMMPGMDGPETARRLAVEPRTRDLPVVLLTARSTSVQELAATGTPVAGVLAKPFDVMVLGRQVQEILRWST